MSVTITIMGNQKYCQDYGLVKYEEYDGEKYSLYPFELNLSNGNFSTFANALGLIDTEEDMWCGEIYPQKLMMLLRQFQPELAVRAEDKDVGDKGCLYINCGLEQDQIDRYVVLLTVMAEEAERREEVIVWG